MENQNHNSKNSFREELSFPVIPLEEETFEFGCNTETTPTSSESPADHFFFNGKLQPHDFPTSRTSSVKSIDSLPSLRSNSTSSIRPESSGSGPERRSSLSHRAKVSTYPKNTQSREENSFWKRYYQQVKKPALTPDFSSSLRWQFITPVAGLKSQSSCRTKFHNVDLESESKENGSSAGEWSGWRVLRLYMTACLSCHAMNPTGADHRRGMVCSQDLEM